MTNAPSTYEIPESAAGQRIDAVVAALTGTSRSIAAAWCSAGFVTLGGATVQKSTRAVPGSRLTVVVPDEPDPLQIVAEPVEGMDILFDDDDFVVIDKPVGVAAHPSPGWVGPTVVGALAAAGYRISTSGAPERVGIVHRLDVGTSGAMVEIGRAHV